MLLLHLLQDAYSPPQEAYQILNHYHREVRQLVHIFKKLLLAGEGRRLMPPAHCHFTGGKQKASQSWAVDSGHTSSQACPTETQGSSTALLWRWLLAMLSVVRHGLPCLWAAQSPLSPEVGATRGYKTDSAKLLFSLKAFSFPFTGEMPKPDKQNPVSPELPRCGPGRVVAAHEQVLRVSGWLSEIPAQLSCQPFPPEPTAGEPCGHRACPMALFGQSS